MIESDLTEQIIGGAIEVHKHWGPGCRVGLLINFNVPSLKQGIKRRVL
ncbi:MAG: hypothetical protein WCS01_02780 [bacterium]|jgi:hypothetical protein